VNKASLDLTLDGESYDARLNTTQRLTK